LQKTIENSYVSLKTGHLGKRLSATPATDYFNPGIGAEINLFSYPLPLHSLHAIEKVVDKELEGSGNINRF